MKEINNEELRTLEFGSKINIKWNDKYANYENENHDGVIVKDRIYYEYDKWDSIIDLLQYDNEKFTMNVRKAHSFRCGMDSTKNIK